MEKKNYLQSILQYIHFPIFHQYQFDLTGFEFLEGGCDQQALQCKQLPLLFSYSVRFSWISFSHLDFSLFYVRMRYSVLSSLKSLALALAGLILQPVLQSSVSTSWTNLEKATV